MPDKHAALKGAQAAVPEDEITDVEVVFPAGTTSGELLSQGLGDAVGGAAEVLGAAAEVGMDATEEAASVVLALSATTLYLLGRHRVGALGSFRHLTPLHQIPREHLHVAFGRDGVLLAVTLTDTATSAPYTFEVKPLGSRIKEMLAPFV